MRAGLGLGVGGCGRAGLVLLGGGGTSTDHVHALTAGRMLGTF